MGHYSLEIHIAPDDGGFVFSGGEVHCKIPFAHPLENHSVQITCRDYTAAGFFKLAMHVEILRRHKVALIDLVLPYLPYARQDRVMQPNEPFSLRVYADMLNALGFDKVTVYDPHSDVGPALIRNCEVIPQWEIAKAQINAGDEEAMFISPDAGAFKKLAKLVTDDSRILIATKERGGDGSIKRTRLHNGELLHGKTAIIVDDICDGGRTFIELAKAIAPWQPRAIVLYVTHGIFSNGYVELEQHFDAILTTNSIIKTNLPDFITQQEIF